MSKYANGQISCMLRVFCAETDHRTKFSLLCTGEMKIWYNHAELSILGHNPHVFASPSHPALCFPKIRGGTSEPICRFKKGEVHFSITFLFKISVSIHS